VKFDGAKRSPQDSFDVLALFQCLMSGFARSVNVYMLCYGREMPSSPIFHPSSLHWRLFHLIFHYCHILVFRAEHLMPGFEIMRRIWALCVVSVVRYRSVLHLVYSQMCTVAYFCPLLPSLWLVKRYNHPFTKNWWSSYFPAALVTSLPFALLGLTKLHITHLGLLFLPLICHSLTTSMMKLRVKCEDGTGRVVPGCAQEALW